MATIPGEPPLTATRVIAGAIPMIYFNGFSITLSGSEISVFVVHDNQAAAKLVMPLPVAKSLIAQLGAALNQYEAATETKIPTVEELTAMLAKLNDKTPI